jgi:hypothetical protein
VPWSSGLQTWAVAIGAKQRAEGTNNVWATHAGQNTWTKHAEAACFVCKEGASRAPIACDHFLLVVPSFVLKRTAVLRFTAVSEKPRRTEGRPVGDGSVDRRKGARLPGCLNPQVHYSLD